MTMAEQHESPPSPLQLAKEDVARVAGFLAYKDRSGTDLENERLLIEILDCLRSIDDKLGRLLEAQRHPR